MAGCKSCSFRFLQIVRVSIYHCQSPLSLSPSLCPSHPLYLSYEPCLFTHSPKGHSSILFPIPNVFSSLLPLEQSAQISIAVYRWLVIWPRVIMNPSQGPDRRLLAPSVSPSPQTWCKNEPFVCISRHFLANTSQLFAWNPWTLSERTEMDMCWSLWKNCDYQTNVWAALSQGYNWAETLNIKDFFFPFGHLLKLWCRFLSSITEAKVTSRAMWII